MGSVWDQYAAWGNYTVTEGDVIEFYVSVDNLADTNAVIKPAKDLIEHSNFHACKIDTGFCTPLVGKTPGLVTHAPASQPVQKPGLASRALCAWISQGACPVSLSGSPPPPVTLQMFPKHRPRRA